jgi:aminomuconate-semialdehyde/2-hydroxymuconate-6-semialdehyde dehydrogenase
MSPRQPEHYRLFIDGAFHDAQRGDTFEDIDPVDGTLVATVAEAGEEDVDRAVRAARRALHGPWRKMAHGERLDLLEQVARRVQERNEEFLHAELADTGKPARLARRIDIPRGAANFRIFSQLARGEQLESYWQDTPDGRGALHYARREPVGVVGVICPWNLPLLLMTWKVAPALAAGNTVVVKPSEETPGTATLLAEVFREVGVPDGVYNVVHGFGPGSAGEAIVRHPEVSAVTFTGESRTGRQIMRMASDDLKKISFELGGKNPAIIFEDADFDDAVAGTLRSCFTNCGQVCLASERIYVERPIFERFVEALAEGAQNLRMGNPYDEATNLGPLISSQHRRKVLDYMELARQEGATVVCGGGVPEMDAPYDGGFFVEPTIWTGLDEDARCVREEIFGPVCHIQPFDDEDEAVAMANDSEYGLCAAVWTQDVGRAHRIPSKLDVGMVWVNTWYLRDLRTPFGGVKLSGLGREGGRHSLDFYSEYKSTCVKL